jgi:hypothetical protein
MNMMLLCHLHSFCEMSLLNVQFIISELFLKLVGNNHEHLYAVFPQFAIPSIIDISINDSPPVEPHCLE